MFGFSWAEIGVILVVALLVIGPKDLPVAIRTATAALRKMRGLAGEFQGHMQELMREADLADVGSELRSLRNFDLGSAIERHIDPVGDLRHAFDPTTGEETPAIGESASFGSSYTGYDSEATLPPDAPAFIPPDAARNRPIPAFIPPGTRIW
ncbi:MAG: Sec-independent protein translocase protein TatB [Acidiphilium sp.]